MRYLFLLFNEEHPENASPEAMAAWGLFEEEVIRRGVKVGAAALQPSAMATTVSVRDGETILVDGPFAETKEQLGGYYLMDCRDLDEAIELATKIPWAPTGHIEVRPVLDLSAASA
jgi:hypothetical protein